MPDRTRTLTANERLTIALVAGGLENQDIAGQIGRSTHHTKRTLQAIFDTAGCCTRLELAVWDFRHNPESQQVILRRCPSIK